MKLLNFVYDGSPRVGALLDAHVIDLARAAALLGEPDFPASTDLLLARPDGIARAQELLARIAEDGAPPGGRVCLALPDIQLLAPVLRPEKIIGIGLNYRDHCAEMGRDPPREIRSFAMFRNALIGPQAPIQLPRNSAQMDWEAELVAVIGRPARHVSAAAALDHIAGYTIGNDVSARDHQAADPATMRGKSGDTHAPIGPWLVTADEIPDPGALDIELLVNGVVKQRSNTRQLVFPVAELVAFLSNYFTLIPGDLIFTGTPGGVGAGRKPPEWLHPGDRIDISIAGIGTLSNPCIAEP